MPSVSVIIPARESSPELLINKLKKLDEGSFKDLEVIVVDDCSPITLEVTDTYGFPVTVIRLNDPTPFNMTVARNKGFEKSKGPWLCFTDIDIIFTSDDLKKLLDLANDENQVVIGCLNLFGTNSVHPGWKNGVTWFCVMSRIAFVKAGKFNEEFKGNYGYDDLFLLYKLNKVTNITRVQTVSAICARKDKGTFQRHVSQAVNRAKYMKLCAK